jgi:uncharacterized protein with HEPN domain
MVKNKRNESYLFDIFIAVNKIKKVISPYHNVKDLVHNFVAWDSVLRELNIISIVGKKLQEEELIRKEYQLIIYFANSISNKIFYIDENLLWRVIKNNIDSFELEIIRHIKEIEITYKNELIDIFINENYYLEFIVKKLRALRD